MKRTFAIVSAAWVAAAGAAWGQTGVITPEKDAHSTHHAGEAKEGAFVDGEVRKVDKDAGKITLKHGPIANLEMPAMSMVFRAKDPAMLEKVKAGDKVRFKADKVGGAYTVTEIVAAN